MRAETSGGVWTRFAPVEPPIGVIVIFQPQEFTDPSVWLQVDKFKSEEVRDDNISIKRTNYSQINFTAVAFDDERGAILYSRPIGRSTIFASTEALTTRNNGAVRVVDVESDLGTTSSSCKPCGSWQSRHHDFKISLT